MPQRRSAIKELRKARTKKMHNLDIKTDLKKTVKKFQVSVEENNLAEAESGLKVVYKKLDKAAKLNIMHQNTASRRKAKFSKAVSKIKSA